MILKHRFTLFALLACLGAALAGCSGSQDEPQPEDTDPGVKLRLVVDTGNKQSRADAPDYYEDPDGAFEDIHTLRVIIVKGNINNPDEAEVEANRLVRTTATGYPIDDILEFKVSTGSKRIYLVANEATLPVPAAVSYSTATAFLDSYMEKSSFSPAILANWLVSLPGSNPGATQGLYSNAKNPNGLPLTEFFDIVVGASSDDLQYDETQTVQLFMTRAAAKASFNIVVDQNYKGAGVNVTGIRLNGLNWQQYVFPRNMTYSPEKEAIITPGKTPEVTKVDRYTTSFQTPQRVNGVTGANVTMALEQPIPIAANTDKTVGPLYFPESLMPATLAADPSACFSVQVELDGNGNWLEAKPLGLDGNNIQLVDGAQAIARNNHIKVTIRFSEANIITATVQLVPYVSVPLKPTFGTE